MKDVMKLKTKREFDIAEQAYAHGQAQGMLNILQQFLNDQLDKEYVREMIEEHGIEMTTEVHIGDGVTSKSDMNNHGVVVDVKDGTFIVHWHKGSLNECETQELLEDLVLANDVSIDW